MDWNTWEYAAPVQFCLQIVVIWRHIRIKDWSWGCGGRKQYHYGRCAVLIRPIVSIKVRLRLNKSKGKKGAMKKRAKKKYILQNGGHMFFYKFKKLLSEGKYSPQHNADDTGLNFETISKKSLTSQARRSGF